MRGKVLEREDLESLSLNHNLKNNAGEDYLQARDCNDIFK